MTTSIHLIRLAFYNMDQFCFFIETPLFRLLVKDPYPCVKSFALPEIFINTWVSFKSFDPNTFHFFLYRLYTDVNI